MSASDRALTHRPALVLVLISSSPSHCVRHFYSTLVVVSHRTIYAAFLILLLSFIFFFFFFNDTATPEIYTLSLHDALPICRSKSGQAAEGCVRTNEMIGQTKCSDYGLQEL